jgi:ATP-binding cassette subfamily F protein uup
VSHDRWFLERVCDVMWALPGDGRLRDLPGGVDEYLALRHSMPGAPGAQPSARSSDGDSRSSRKELARIERRLERIAEAETELHAELAEHATDHERVLALDTALRGLAQERAELEDRWLAVADDAG